MTGSTGRDAAVAVGTWIALVAVAAAIVVVAVADDAGGAAEDFTVFAVPLAAMSMLTGTVGLLIRLRRPGNGVGRLMAIGPAVMIAGFLGYALGALRMHTDGAGDLLGQVAATAGATMTLPGIFLTYPAVILVFPDGRLPSPRWRNAVVPVVGALVTSSALTLVAPTAGNLRRSSGADSVSLPANPFALPGMPADLAEVAGAIGSIALIASTLLAVAAVVVRFRGSAGVPRLQLKWLAAAGIVAGVLFPVSFATDVGPAQLIDVLSIVAVGFVPVAIGIAILRYRLYDIDRLVSRTVSWTLVTAILVGVFAAGVIGLQGLLAGVTQGRTLAVAASTLLAFALFQPVRRGIQRLVDRRFDRARYDRERLLDRFAATIRGEVNLRSVEESVTAIAGDAIRPMHVALWLHDGRSVTMSERP